MIYCQAADWIFNLGVIKARVPEVALVSVHLVQYVGVVEVGAWHAHRSKISILVFRRGTEARFTGLILVQFV